MRLFAWSGVQFVVEACNQSYKTFAAQAAALCTHVLGVFTILIIIVVSLLLFLLLLLSSLSLLLLLLQLSAHTLTMLNGSRSTAAPFYTGPQTWTVCLHRTGT
jgi:hypothetical protein